MDLYTPHSSILELLYGVLGTYEQCAFPPLRRAAIQRCYELVVMEDDNTDYQTLGPVSKMMNLIVRAHVDGRESVAYKRHFERRQDFMWLAREGMMMCGTNGSQLWDIAFISQALVETGLAEEEGTGNKEAAVKALKWLDECQIREDPKWTKEAYRHTSKGAWPFSTKEQGYTVSDCTGEGLKAVIYLQEHVP